MKVAIHGRVFKTEIAPYIQELFDLLQAREAQIQVSAEYLQILRKSQIRLPSVAEYGGGSDLFDPDVMLTLGGDGTMLDAVTHMASRQVPMLGINLGRLGFLAMVSPKDIKESIDALFEGDYVTETRSLIAVETEDQKFGTLNFGLNEFAIQKTDTSSMITIKTWLDGEYLNTYWADGLIVSTPTGSTGYLLSVGGPLVMPQSSNFVVAPMSPHNLNVRPLVISDHSELLFEVESRSGQYLISLDSRYLRAKNGEKISVKKAPFEAILLKLPQQNFLDTLRHKLHWGLDVRN
jgi:NAD+ kinase